MKEIDIHTSLIVYTPEELPAEEHFPANGDTGSTVLFFTGGCHAGKS